MCVRTQGAALAPKARQLAQCSAATQNVSTLTVVMARRLPITCRHACDVHTAAAATRHSPASCSVRALYQLL